LEEYEKYRDDKSITVTSVDELTPEILLISFMKNKEWIEEHDCSNIGIRKN